MSTEETHLWDAIHFAVSGPASRSTKFHAGETIQTLNPGGHWTDLPDDTTVFKLSEEEAWNLAQEIISDIRELHAKRLRFAESGSTR